MRFVAPDGLWTGLLGPQTVASARASRSPGEPLDGPSGAPDGGLCKGLPAPRRTSGPAFWHPRRGPLYRLPSPQETYI